MTEVRKTIRVAIMADEFDRRPERTLYFRRLIESLLKEPSIDLTLVHSKRMPGEDAYQKAREVLLPRIPLPFGTRFLSFIRYSLFTKDRYDIVFWCMPRVFPFFWLFPAKHQVVMAHGGGDVLLPGIWTLSRIIFNYTLIWCQRFVAVMVGVSDYANKEIQEAYRMKPEKVRTIYNAVDPLYAQPPSDAEVARVRERYAIGAGDYFVYLGRFRVHKNVGHVVNGYLRYREEHPLAREILVLGGSFKDEYERTFGTVPSSPFADDIKFIGYVHAEDLPGLYRGARALAFMSLNEGFGLPVIEAMAVGTPVITSSVTSLPEVGGDAAIILDPHDVEGLAAAFHTVAADQAARAAMIERGFAHSAKFTWEKTLQGWMSLFRELCNR